MIVYLAGTGSVDVDEDDYEWCRLLLEEAGGFDDWAKALQVMKLLAPKHGMAVAAAMVITARRA